MLLTSTQGIPSSLVEEESSLLRLKIEEFSSLRRKIEELNQNTVLLIAEAGRLIQGSKQLLDQLKSFGDPRTNGMVQISSPMSPSGSLTLQREF